jgi:putative zinc finger/helix-turn-helix YgiT family protein
MMKTVKTFCPECWEAVDANVMALSEIMDVKGEDISVVSEIPVCPKCGEKIGDSRLEADNVKRAYDIYRARHNLVSPSDIKKLRSKYGISQRSLALLLGIGEASIVRYEEGSLPSKSNNTLLRSAQDDSFMRHAFTGQGKKLPPSQQKTMSEVLSGNPDVQYHYFDAKVLSGYRVLDINRMAQCIHILSEKLNASYVTRVMKALFFADFMQFEQSGESITGLTYAALPMGPVPDGYRNLLQILETENLIEIQSDKVGSLVFSKNVIPTFDAGTVAMIHLAAEFVNSFQNTTELSEYTHKLFLWTRQQNGDPIPYSSDGEVGRLVEMRLKEHKQ